MLYVQGPQASVSTAFSSSPNFSGLLFNLDRNMENMYSISLRKYCNEKTPCLR